MVSLGMLSVPSNAFAESLSFLTHESFLSLLVLSYKTQSVCPLLFADLISLLQELAHTQATCEINLVDAEHP